MKKMIIANVLVLTLLVTMCGISVLAVNLLTQPSVSTNYTSTISQYNNADYVFQTAAKAGNWQTANESSYVLLETQMSDNTDTHFIVSATNTNGNNVAGQNYFYPNGTWSNVKQMNTDFAANTLANFDTSFKPYINTAHVWTTEGNNVSGSTVQNSYDAAWALNLLSFTELIGNSNKIGYLGMNSALCPQGKDAFWLRTSALNNNEKILVFSKWGTVAPVAFNVYYNIKPSFWINDQFFLNVKLDLAHTGIKVKEMLVANYRDLLNSSLYTDQELLTIGFTQQDIDAAQLIREKIERMVADSVTVSPLYANYTVSPGFTLKAEYTCSNEDASGATPIYSWYYCDTVGGQYNKITDTTQNQFVLTNVYANKYIKAGVTLSDGTLTGQTILSENAVSIGAVLGSTINATVYYLMNSASDPNAWLYGTNYQTSDFTSADPAGNLIVPLNSNYKYSLLETSNGNDKSASFFVLAGRDTNYGNYTFDVNGTSKFDPADVSNIAYYLNDKNGLFYASLDGNVKPYIDEDHIWLTSGGAYYDNYVSQCGISLLSYFELKKYYPQGKLATALSSNRLWWLRDSSTKPSTDSVEYNIIVTESNAMYPKLSNQSIAIRPCFWLNNDFFLNVKMDLNSTGTNIKQMMKNRYTREQLSSLYNSNELLQIFSEDVYASNINIAGIPSVGQQLTGIYTYNNSNPSAVESGSTYQWYRSADGINYSPIDGAFGNSYIVTQTDLNKYLKFGVRVFDSEGLPAVQEGLSSATSKIQPAKPLAAVFNGINGSIQSGSITAAFNIANTGEQTTIVLLLAVYTDANEMLKLSVVQPTITIGTNEYTVSMNDVPSNAKSIKAMAWNSLDQIAPLCVVGLE